jgi:cytochrome c-type biogenesis protein CcmH
MARRAGPWIVLAGVLAGLLWVGAQHSDRPRTLDERVLAVARDVRCPTCESQSAADSNAPASEAIRGEIRAQLKQGRSPAQIRAFLVSRFGSDILLKPEASGIAGLVWAIPVVVLVVAALGLGLGFRRWRPAAAGPPTPDERDAVERAMREGVS